MVVFCWRIRHGALRQPCVGPGKRFLILTPILRQVERGGNFMRDVLCRAFQSDLVLVRRLLWLIALLLATQAYPQSAGPEFPNPGNAHMSRDKQRAIGLQAAAQVYQQMPVVPDNSPETQYIRQLGQKLVATIPPEHSWPFEFHVVAQKDINAFALPGGPMFVNIGTITAAANEAQLAGVMGHEMSHVYMQHSAKQE